MPSSKAGIAIPVDSLLKLPSQAVYTHHSGQATATIAKKGEVIYVTATCDSLQREVEYYEEMYYKARDALETLQHEANVKIEQKKTPTGEKIGLFAIGFVAGVIVITIKNNKT